MTITGALIGESLKVGATVEGIPLTVRKISRAECGDEAAGQPRVWTFIEFEAADEDAARVADAFSGALDPRLGWYCDYRSDTETFVVFAGHIFRYARGDHAARLAAEDHARSVGVPESQLDWPE